MPRFPLKSITRTIASGLAAASLLASTSLSAQGDLLVAPTRVVIDNRGTAQIILSNIGDKEATYRISAELMRMTEDGDLVPVDTDAETQEEQEALELVRFAPRRVILPPGQPQTIRLSARPPADLPDGEYRIHLSFKGLPDVTPVSQDPAKVKPGQFAFQLIPVYSISIPVIVRKGNLEATAAISNPRLEQGPHGEVLKLDMSRSGSASVFGEIRVMRPGRSDPVMKVRGIAIYPEITHRELVLPLTPEQATLLKGRLRFEYREFPENGGTLLASVEGSLG